MARRYPSVMSARDISQYEFNDLASCLHSPEKNELGMISYLHMRSNGGHVVIIRGQLVKETPLHACLNLAYCV